jgi:hypothetical protein
MRVSCGFLVGPRISEGLLAFAKNVPTADFFDQEGGRIVRVAKGSVVAVGAADEARIRAVLKANPDHDVDPDDADFFVDNGDFFLPRFTLVGDENPQLEDHRSIGSMAHAKKELETILEDAKKHPSEYAAQPRYLDTLRWLAAAIEIGERERLAIGVAYY